MKPLRFAIIGCGRIAQRHAAQMRRVGELAAVCDIVEEKAKELAAAYNAVWYASIHELLSAGLPIDVIVICTPNGLHAEHSILSFRKGYHVLVEKPMAISSDDAAAMIEEAERSGRKLFLVMQNRFNPPVLAVKKALGMGAFGEISSVQLTCLWNRDDKYYHGSWKGTVAMDGGILYTQFSHFIDVLYWYFGEVKNVQAITANQQHTRSTEFEDCSVVNLEFQNGILGSLHFSVNSFRKNKEGSLTILGEKGMVKIGGEYLNTIEYASFENYELETGISSAGANDYGHYQGSMSNHDKVYSNLADTLLHGKPYYVDATDGWQTVSVIERIYLASAR